MSSKDTIQLRSDGKYHLTPEQFSKIKVRLPATFAKSGYTLVAGQLPNGDLTTGITKDFNPSKLKSLGDLQRLYGLKRLLLKPETLAKQKDNMEQFKNCVFKILEKKDLLDFSQFVIHESMRAELIRLKIQDDIIKKNRKDLEIMPHTTTDELGFKDFLLNQFDRAKLAINQYICSLVTGLKVEKEDLNEYFLRSGTTSWFIAKFTQQRFEKEKIPKEFWNMVYRHQLDRSLSLNLTEIQHPEVFKAYRHIPGVSILRRFIEFIEYDISKVLTEPKVVEFNNSEKEVDLKKITFLIPPIGYMADTIKKGLKTIRPACEDINIRDYVLFWNKLVLTNFGILDAEAARKDFYKEVFNLDLGQFRNINEMWNTVNFEEVTRDDTLNFMNPKVEPKYFRNIMSKAGMKDSQILIGEKAIKRILAQRIKVKGEAKEDGTSFEDVIVETPLWTFNRNVTVMYAPLTEIEKKDFRFEPFTKAAETDLYKRFTESRLVKHLFDDDNEEESKGDDPAQPTYGMHPRASAYIEHLKHRTKFGYMAKDIRRYLSSFENEDIRNLVVTEIDNTLANFESELEEFQRTGGGHKDPEADEYDFKAV